MKSLAPRTLALFLLVVLVPGVAQAAPLRIPDGDSILAEIKTLSAPEMEGRASGTPGAAAAASHIAAAFRQAGLRPGGEGASYLQPFDVPTGIRLGPTNTLAALGLGGAPRALALGRDFTPLTVSADGHVEAPLVFAGYGITAPDLHWDDYAGLDVKGKVVLVLTGEPREEDQASPFRRPQAYHYSERSHKVINAREHGARAILLVTRPSPRAEHLPALRGISQPWGIVAAFVTRTVGDALVAPLGRSLAELADAIDRGPAPRSAAVPGVAVRLDAALVREHGATANVVGVLPGNDPRVSDQAIVIGAHYDHLGRGGEGSLAPDRVGEIHPGADDNASGTATVMALARAFAAAGPLPRTLVFVAFSGEEMGLLGSNFYVHHPVVPLEHTVLMVNLDMVGRLRDGKLYVSGVDSGTGLRDTVAEAEGGLPLVPELSGTPFAQSDQTSFYAAAHPMPVLFLFTGPHADYHRPTDTWDKINAAGLETVATVTARIVSTVAREAVPPTYVKLQAPPIASARAKGYGPYLGVVPDFGATDGAGVRITGVRAGSPAEKAGVQAGDVIVRLGEVSVKTLEDLVFALRSKRAGDHVEVLVVRDGRQEHFDATLEDRK